jgi:hypothetical protein
VIYFRSHIQALEARHLAHVHALEKQIEYLQSRLERAEREAREAVQFQSRAHIDTLKSGLDDARLRANGLLDRVLEKNNIGPVIEQPKTTAQPDLLLPFGVNTPEAQEAYKESWVREETEFIMNRDGCDEGTARAYAEKAYVDQFQVIK